MKNDCIFYDLNLKNFFTYIYKVNILISSHILDLSSVIFNDSFCKKYLDNLN